MKRRALQLSPILVIGAGHLTARLCANAAGHMRWIPVILVLWAAMLACTFLFTNREERRNWYGPSQGAIGWRILALLIGFAGLPLLLKFGKLMATPYIWVPALVFCAINPFVEESYWRGALGSATANWPAWLSILYTSAVFALSHPLVLGVFSRANRTPEVTISTFVLGIVWAVVYRKTRSLRWPILSHLMVDALNLSVATFLNLYTPRMR